MARVRERRVRLKLFWYHVLGEVKRITWSIDVKQFNFQVDEEANINLNRASSTVRFKFVHHTKQLVTFYIFFQFDLFSFNLE